MSDAKRIFLCRQRSSALSYNPIPRLPGAEHRWAQSGPGVTGYVGHPRGPPARVALRPRTEAGPRPKEPPGGAPRRRLSQAPGGGQADAGADAADADGGGGPAFDIFSNATMVYRSAQVRLAPVDNLCRKGHTGIACGECIHSYAYQGSFCQYCNPDLKYSNWDTGRLVLVASIVLAGVLLLFYLFFYAAFRKNLFLVVMSCMGWKVKRRKTLRDRATGKETTVDVDYLEEEEEEEEESAADAAAATAAWSPCSSTSASSRAMASSMNVSSPNSHFSHEPVGSSRKAPSGSSASSERVVGGDCAGCGGRLR